MNYTAQSIIEFVKVGSEASNGTAQTGDNLGLIFLLLAAVLCCVSLSIKIAFKNKQLATSNNSKSAFDKMFPKYMPWLLLIAAAITLCFSVLSLANYANAEDSQISAGNTKIEYDVNTHEIKCNNIPLTNNTGEKLNITKVSTELLNEYAQNLSCTLMFGDKIIYNNTIPGEQTLSAAIEQNNTLTANFNFDNDTASKLEDGQIAIITYTLETSIPTIYPLPQNTTYNGEKFHLASSINVTCDNTIDQATKDYASELLTEKGVKPIFTSGSTAMDNYVILKTSSDTNKYKALAESDGYVLNINSSGITIIGKNTDAVYMALSTLKEILMQSGTVVLGLDISDWAQAEWRGFIEGYYGIPWSNANRISLMEFGRQFKMNSYIFAPKDDEYHSAKWKYLYPEDKLASMKELADAGLKYKVDFTWAIHPFQHDAFDFTNYERDLKFITDKYEQLYSIGVRHFGLSADDIEGSNISAENQLKLVKSLDEWCRSKEGVKKLVFVPECYQKGRGGEPHFSEYWKVMKTAPATVDLMWTGDDVYAPASQDTFDYFKSVSNHEAYMWWNFPVNDYAKNHLVMGPTYGLLPGVNNFIGLVANPMQQAQASKVALFSVAAYLWNNKNFDADKTWENAFKYVDTGASEALKLLSKHMCFSKEIWQANFDESVYMQPTLNSATAQLNNNLPLDDNISATLIANYNEIKTAIANYRSNYTNTGLYEEMQPWLDSFDKQCDASLLALQAISMVKAGDIASAQELYAQAQAAFNLSKTFEVPILPGTDKVYAEAGSKFLVPFVNTMFNYLQKI